MNLVASRGGKSSLTICCEFETDADEWPAHWRVPVETQPFADSGADATQLETALVSHGQSIGH